MAHLDIGRAVRICRAVRHMHQYELARAMDIGPSMISLVESGKRCPSLPALDRVAAACGIPLEWFILLASDTAGIDAAPPETCVSILRWMQGGAP